MSLWVPIGINNRLFKSGLSEMRSQASQFSGAIKGMFASAFAAGAIIAGFKGWMQEMDRVQKLGQRFNETAESIQRVGLASNLAGADLELAAKTAAKLTQFAGEAAGGNATLNAQFEELNINAAEFVGLSLEDKYIALSKAYQEAEGSGAKMVTFLKILGEEGQNIIPLLAQGPEALQASFDSASVASQGTVDSIAAFNDQMTILKQNATPFFAWLIQALRTFTSGLGSLVAGNISQIMAAVNFVRSNIMSLADALAKLGKGDFSGAVDSIKEIGSNAKTMVQDIMNGWSGAWAQVSSDYDEIWNGGSKGKSGAAKLTADYGDLGEAVKKLKNIQAEIAAMEKANREAAMSDEQRLQAMIAERNELLAKSNDETEEGLDAKKDAIALEGKIAEAQRRAAKEKSDREKKHQDKLAQAREAEADADEKLKLAGMSEEEKRQYATDKKDALYKEAEDLERKGDKIGASEKRTEAKGIEADLLSGTAGPTAKPGFSVAATSLASAGGGGFVAQTPSDPLLRAQEKANNTLERIARAVEDSESNNPPPEPK